MKRLFLGLLCGLLCFVSIQGYAQIKVGVTAGFNDAGFWQTDGFEGLDPEQSVSPINAFHGGIMGELELRNNWFLQASVLYFESGAHLRNRQGLPSSGNFNTDLTNTTLRIYALRVPVNFIYKINTGIPYKGANLKILLGGGAYISQTLSGTEKGYSVGHSSAPGDDNTVPVYGKIDNKVQISDQLSYAALGISRVAPLDAGGTLLLGAEWKKYELNFNYSRGFSRVYRSTFANTGNNVFSFSLVYFLYGHARKPKL